MNDFQCQNSDNTSPGEIEPEKCIVCGEADFDGTDKPTEPDSGMSATYSAEDNKLRLYAAHRLDGETYERVKSAGFKWAPKQDLFVAPKWTPAREDLCVELAGDIEPEGTTLAERAEFKAARLDTIAENKARKANAFQRAADELSRSFEGGQPILVGHHSERKARKTQNQMHSAMRNAAENRDAISYWQYRAQGVERHANYKNKPAVRARRIKTLLSELRDLQRDINHAATWLTLFQRATSDEQIKLFAGSMVNSRTVCAGDDYQMFHDGEITAAELKIRSMEKLQRIIDSPTRHRWIDHTLNRLAYERDMLGPVARYDGELTPVILQAFVREHGADKPKGSVLPDGRSRIESSVALPAHIGTSQCLELTADEWRDLMQSAGYEVPAKKDAKPPILNFRAETFTSASRYHRGKIDTFEQVEMTKADYSRVHSEQRGTRLSACGAFRFKICSHPFHEGPRYMAPWVAVLLTDSKMHDAPTGEGS